MQINYQVSETRENHEFAHSASYGGIIHITSVKESGRHDFICLGCQKPMQAILRKIYGLKPYFRHDVQDVPASERCTFSNEQYRRKIALETLKIEKHLHLPPLYKLPPKGLNGPAIPLLPGQSLHFSELKQAQNIFQSEDGSIVFDKTLLGEPNEFLLTADAVCYNDDGEPILLILFSDGKRKKMDVGLMAALALLRINTVIITPAKASPEEIHNGVLTGKNTKWLYHDDERQFDYFSLSEDLGGAVPAADVDQGQLFEETFDCRKAEINNLIRAVNKCLGTESYLAAENGNRRIIGETELAIRDAERRRDEFEERYRAESDAAHRVELDAIAERRERFKREKTEFDRIAQDLEERYLAKKRELEESRRIVESNLRAADLSSRGRRKPIATLRSELERRVKQAGNRMDELFEREIRSIDSQRADVERVIASEGAAVNRLRSLIEKEPNRIKQLLGDKAAQFDQLEANTRSAIEQIQTDGENLPRRFARETVNLTAEFDGARKRTVEAAEKRDASGNSEFSRRLKGLLDGRGLFLAIEDARSDQRRYHAAKEFLDSPAGEAWLRTRKS